MKVLVTGATGFLGQWLVLRLLDEGLDVRILKRASTGLDRLNAAATAGRIEICEGDITSPESLLRACDDVDSVFHLAGLIAYRPSDRAAMDLVNIQGTANVIEACVAKNVRRLLHLSSVVAVGASFDGKVLLNEESPYNVGHLNMGYFETKHRAEILVRQAVASGKLDAVMINPSTIYGRGDAKKGSRGTQVKVALGKFPFYTSGGVNIIAVEDAITCIVNGWKVGRSGERYIASGENILIKELFEIIASEAGVAAPSLRMPTPALHLIGSIGDAMGMVGLKGPISSENAWTSTLFHWFDSSKAQRELDLKITPARVAIANSVQYILENH